MEQNKIVIYYNEVQNTTLFNITFKYTALN